MKFDPAGIRFIQSQDMGQMPADGFPFPVRVSCQVDFIGLGRFRLQGTDQISLAANIYVFGFKPVLHIDTQGALGQIPEMSHGRGYRIIFSQKFSNGF